MYREKEIKIGDATLMLLIGACMFLAAAFVNIIFITEYGNLDVWSASLLSCVGVISFYVFIRRRAKELNGGN